MKSSHATAGVEFEKHRSETLQLIEQLQAKVLAWGRGRDVDFGDVSDVKDCLKAVREANHWAHS